MHDERILIIAAHPDDEIIGAGAQFAKWGDRLTIAHATDGSPTNLMDARATGFESGEEYAQARFREALAAGAMAGIGERQYVRLGFHDQELAFNLDSLEAELARLLRIVRPQVVFTHPYEGGHPDHDAIAWAAAQCRHPEFALMEFSSYHSGPEGIETGSFLNGRADVEHKLTAQQRNLKRAMLDCFRSQADMLKHFGTEVERFRAAPVYDFSQPPHGGRLYYEHFNWGITGERFRELASIRVHAYCS